MSSTIDRLAETLPGIVEQHQHMCLYLLPGPADRAHQILTNLNLGDTILVPFETNWILACDTELVVDGANILEKLR
jgi:hypothetical protein